MKTRFLLLACTALLALSCQQASKGPIRLPVPPREAGQTDMLQFAADPIENVGIGVVGLGMRGGDAVQRLSLVPGAVVTAICDLLPERVEASRADLAQMGKPSMILPIMVALYYPERGPRLLEEFDPFDPKCCNLTFEKCDTDVFRLLDLAYDAGRQGGLLPAVMNAANEVAVFEFLKKKASYTDIERVVTGVFDEFNKRGDGSGDLTLESILEADREARVKAKELLRI